MKSSSRDTQEKTAASLTDISKSSITNTSSMYSSPHESGPPEGSDTVRTKREFEDELGSCNAISPALLTPPTSPPSQKPNITLRETNRMEVKPRINVSTLKSLLGLDDWRCGALKPNGQPCRMEIGHKTQDRVIFQIESMIELQQSSSDFDIQLNKLVMLVHCHYHDHGYVKDSRIEAWTMVFPTGDDNIDPLVLIERKIRKALGRVETECIGITVKKVRCRHKIGGEKVENCLKTINEIVKPEVYLEGAYFDWFLKVLETNMYCHVHLNKQGYKKVALWRSTITEILEKADAELAGSTKRNTTRNSEDQARTSNPDEFESISAEKGNDIVLRHLRSQTPPKSQPLFVEFNQDPVKFWPKAFNINPFEIIARSDRIADYQSSYTLLQSEITKRLDYEDQRDGYIYMYEVEGNKGFVKIGYTTQTREKRHEEWRYSCNRDPKVLYPTSPDSSMKIPNARRVEALCHAELDHRRTRIYCRGCLKQHIEWFEINPAEAIGVIQKWSKWMATHPYQLTQIRKATHWSLKEEEKRKVANIDQFLKDMSAVAMPIMEQGNSEPRLSVAGNRSGKEPKRNNTSETHHASCTKT